MLTTCLNNLSWFFVFQIGTKVPTNIFLHLFGSNGPLGSCDKNICNSILCREYGIIVFDKNHENLHYVKGVLPLFKNYICFSSIFIGLSTTVHFPGAKHTRPSPALDRDKDITGNLELGELGQLTITNDNESSYDVSIDEFFSFIFFKKPF